MSERFVLSRRVIGQYTGLDVSFLSCLLVPEPCTSLSLFKVRYYELIHYILVYTRLCAECTADHPSYMSRSGFSQPSTTGSLISSFSERGELWGSHSVPMFVPIWLFQPSLTSHHFVHLKKSRFRTYFSHFLYILYYVFQLLSRVIFGLAVDKLI